MPFTPGIARVPRTRNTLGTSAAASSPLKL
ncbi:hypothetical protein EYZ11_010675 [Aspergillus tanneri]|uniref:Uncharacterized protein n=1 Tax=Aspergillus tanneri TaxID=1220188 RepID=A0A4S3J5A1_9EURO|nr:hypothetical protein EYZ11_010675 [Aspergillus tanneri]